jgi:nitroimidazol reductase NimA-like FMN-containing flavoprotein (pyridoxamine 5'-phosphate oxidase superfamily)
MTSPQPTVSFGEPELEVEPEDEVAGPASDRVRVRRLAARGRYDRQAIDAILDEGFVCHLGFSVDGTTWVLPTAYGREGDELYVHGAVGNHALRTLQGGMPACITVTLVDGVVLARSAFHHSINYRSVVLFGVTQPVHDVDEKRHALEVIVDHVVPGRVADARPVTPSEIRATTVLRLPIEEASAKVRTGGPNDDPEDLELGVWAGQIPLTLTPGRPIPDPLCEGLGTPAYATSYQRPG